MGIVDEPRAEAEDGTDRYPIATRACYLIPAKETDAAYRLFEVLADRLPGVVISRMHPDLVRTRRGVPGRAMWLTESIGPDRVDPRALDRLRGLILEYIDENGGKAVVMLDGVEYLVQKNGFDRTFDFLEHVNDDVVLRAAIVLMPVSPEALEEKEWSVLERFFPVRDGTTLQADFDADDVLRRLDGGA